MYVYPNLYFRNYNIGVIEKKNSAESTLFFMASIWNINMEHLYLSVNHISTVFCWRYVTIFPSISNTCLYQYIKIPITSNSCNIIWFEHLIYHQQFIHQNLNKVCQLISFVIQMKTKLLNSQTNRNPSNRLKTKLASMVILMCKTKVSPWGSNMTDLPRTTALGGHGVTYSMALDSVCFLVSIL